MTNISHADAAQLRIFMMKMPGETLRNSKPLVMR
jgi:hypothetical protein